MTTTVVAKMTAPAIPVKHDTLFAFTPGSDVVLSGVLDGHSADQIWVLMCYTTGGTPPELMSDFEGLGHNTQILAEEAYSQKIDDGVTSYTVTIKAAFTGGDCTKAGWIAFVVAAAGTSPDPGAGLLVVLGPYHIR